MQIGEKALDDTSAQVAPGDKLTNAGKAHCDERVLGGGKKTVESHERQDTDEADRKHKFSGIP